MFKTEIIKNLCKEKNVLIDDRCFNTEAIVKSCPYFLYNANFFALSFNPSSSLSHYYKEVSEMYEELSWGQLEKRKEVSVFLTEVACIQLGIKVNEDVIRDANRICELIDLARLDGYDASSLYAPFMLESDAYDLSLRPHALPRVQAALNLLTRSKDAAREELEVLGWYQPEHDRSKRAKREIKKVIKKYL